MRTLAPKLGCRSAKPELRLRGAGLGLLIFILSIAFAGTASAKQDSTNPQTPHSTARMQFAVADFDGDVRPDLATIESGPNHAGATDYWVQLRLTTAGRQSIRLVAPPGGLWIEARDVNGDHAVDLVLTTAWFNQPVAILINDGHGRFSRVQPGPFAGGFSESGTNWGSDSRLGLTPVGLPAQSSVIFETQTHHVEQVPQTRLYFGLNRASHADLRLDSIRGRAPPARA